MLHTRPDSPHASEPLQFGAEIYGHAGLEADLEVQELMEDLKAIGVSGLVLGLSDVRLVRGVLNGLGVGGPTHRIAADQLLGALAARCWHPS